MKNLTTYIHFDGKCRQAVQFYAKCLGAELQLIPHSDESGKPSSDPNAQVMHSFLSRNGQPLLMASDGCPSGRVITGNNFSVCIECESHDEIERLFEAIGENGKVILPLGDMPWGARFGMLTDQFGIQWLFNFTQGQ